MSQYTIYNQQNGEIIKTLSGPAEIIALNHDPETESAWPGDYDANGFYITETGPEQRPETPYTISANAVAADGVDEVVITGLGDSTVVEVLGQEATTDDGEMTLTFDQPGDYTVTITAPFPAMPATEFINAT